MWRYVEPLDASKPLEPMLRQVVDKLASATGFLGRDEGRHPRCQQSGPYRAAVRELDRQHADAWRQTRASCRRDRGELPGNLGGECRRADPSAALAQLLKPFGNDGLGLGLHIVSMIAEAHGGPLTVASSAEETRFTFLMSLASD